MYLQASAFTYSSSMRRVGTTKHGQQQTSGLHTTDKRSLYGSSIHSPTLCYGGGRIVTFREERAVGGVVGTATTVTTTNLSLKLVTKYNSNSSGTSGNRICFLDVGMRRTSRVHRLTSGFATRANVRMSITATSSSACRRALGDRLTGSRTPAIFSISGGSFLG